MGLKDWFEVFRTGTHTDNKGNTREWTVEDLDKAVKSYNPEHQEAPLVIGHPKTNAPAYGWAEGLKREGNILYAKARQVLPEFEEAVKSGRYKKRSISFYPDGTLRHIGFLGAQPPAVKGLVDVQFKEGEEYNEYEETINNHMPPGAHPAPAGEGGDMPKTVEELEKDLAKERAAKETAEKKAAEFKEKADKTTADFAEAEKKRTKQEIAEFVEKGIKEGKILPAWKEQGLVEFMEHLAGVDGGATEIEFSEGDNTVKSSPLEWFKKFVTNFGEHPLFKEMVRPKDEKPGESTEFAEEDAEGKRIAATVQTPDKK